MTKPTLPYINPDLFAEPSMQEQETVNIAIAREAMGAAFDAMLEASLEQFQSVELKQFLVQDVVLFCLFIGSIKMIESAGVVMEKRQILSAFNHLLKRAEREIPEQILNFANSLASPMDTIN